MKVLRVGSPGQERPALLDAEGRLRDLTGVVSDIDGRFVTSSGVDRVRDSYAAESLPVLDAGAPRIGPPIRPGKIACIRLNYRDHAAESGPPIPDEPVVFMKAPATVIRPMDRVPVPRGSTKTDWEVELAVVIGRTARYLGSAADALARLTSGKAQD